MYLSKLFIPILKETPAEAKIKSHQLMLRAGMIKQSSTGIYSWLPLGFKIMKKIEQIVREEQNKIGAQELLMPTIQSAEIWKESGRYEDYGKEMLRIKDRQGKEMLYGPTNEELITEIFRTSVKSYKSLPQLLYHIQWKFRDELRPRFGVMRCKEFFMKDAYSFDLSDDEARKSYNKMFFAYLNTFKRLGLTAIPMEADTGPIGGDLSHEFVILAETGESKIYSDKRIFDLDISKYNGKDDSIKELRKKYGDFYAVTDDKFNKDDFEKKVKKENQLITKGIEVGHIFYFGTKYSEKLNAYVQNKDGKNLPVHMGSYGIGISRLVGAIIEAYHDDKGIKWPLPVAPFTLSIINLMPEDKNCSDTAVSFYNKFLEQEIDVILDDRICSIGKKLSDNELIGVPIQLIIGKRDLNEGVVELKNRLNNSSKKISLDSAINNILSETKI